LIPGIVKQCKYRFLKGLLGINFPALGCPATKYKVLEIKKTPLSMKSDTTSYRNTTAKAGFAFLYEAVKDATLFK
jgi:hypothetical protein